MGPAPLWPARDGGALKWQAAAQCGGVVLMGHRRAADRWGSAQPGAARCWQVGAHPLVLPRPLAANGSAEYLETQPLSAGVAALMYQPDRKQFSNPIDGLIRCPALPPPAFRHGEEAPSPLFFRSPNLSRVVTAVRVPDSAHTGR